MAGAFGLQVRQVCLVEEGASGNEVGCLPAPWCGMGSREPVAWNCVCPVSDIIDVGIMCVLFMCVLSCLCVLEFWTRRGLRAGSGNQWVRCGYVAWAVAGIRLQDHMQLLQEQDS